MRERIRDGLTYSNVMSTLCFFLLLSGGVAYAAGHLGKNSVGTKQLKNNAVTLKKLKKNSVNGSKVKNNSLTGADIKLSKLGTVPSAKSAATANTADTANSANSLAPPEGWHQVGGPGEPGFQNSWVNAPIGYAETVAFYKDAGGVVHLRGLVAGGSSNVIFQLPPGYRPASGKAIIMPVACTGGVCTNGTSELVVVGAAGAGPAPEGAVYAPSSASSVSLNGIAFRAES